MESTANLSNAKGFTLIEFLVAIVILMVGMLGLLQTVNYAISHNMTNQLRQTALMVGDEIMNREKIKPFDSISTTPAPLPAVIVLPQMVNGAYRNYSVVRTNTAPTSQSKQLDTQVVWHYKGVRYVHSVVTIVTKSQQ